jgi:alkyldihydroxyacetonephosphate synthase
MRRWNGWGDEANHYPMPAGGQEFLEAEIGEGHILPDSTLASVCDRVPPSRLPKHPLIDVSAQMRVRHARGQSLPDWLAMRSGAFGIFPDGVAHPSTPAEIRLLMAFAAEHNCMLIPYGGGTSVAGHITPSEQSRPIITMSLAKMNTLIDLDEVSQIATFGPGTKGPEIEAQLRPLGYLLGHFPQSYELSTVGGWVATRSSGQQSWRYGRIEQMLAGCTLETYRGTLEVPAIPASSAGLDLREMVMGSEGRFGVISQVKVRVSPLPESESFNVAFAPSWDSAIALARRAAQLKVPLSMLRLSNAIETRTQLALAGKPDAIIWLERYLKLRGVGVGKSMITFGLTGTKLQCKGAKTQLRRLFSEFGVVDMGSRLGDTWAHSRFRSPYLRQTLWSLGYAVDTLETAVNWRDLPQAVESIERAIRDAVPDLPVHVFTHLSHIYPQGASIYTSYIFPNAQDYETTLEYWRAMKPAASKAILACGGTISHQHGVGRDHATYLAAEKGTLGIESMGVLAKHFDPNAHINPGVLIDTCGKEHD